MPATNLVSGQVADEAGHEVGAFLRGPVPAPVDDLAFGRGGHRRRKLLRVAEPGHPRRVMTNRA